MARLVHSSLGLLRSPSWPYVAPFATLLLLLALDDLWGRPPIAYALRMLIVSLVLLLVSRRVVTLAPRRFLASVFIGAGVFAIWIGPDLLWPGYRDHWLFQNALMGTLRGHASQEFQTGALWLLPRVAGSVILVPIVEEIFWRAWLMRYLISRDFQSVPAGAYAPASFWITAVLFASEHGPYWDVGLLAGIAYNWWMVRTKNVADCILAHAVTNACLAAYVVAAEKWEYWM